MSETFKPVKNPANPSFLTICLHASVTPPYSLKPRTSNLVLIMTSGFDITDCTVLARALEHKRTYDSGSIPDFLKLVSK